MVQTTAVRAQSAALARAGTAACRWWSATGGTMATAASLKARRHVKARGRKGPGGTALNRSGRENSRRQSFAASAHPNRHYGRIEHDASHCKQRTTVQSTRHKRGTLDSKNGCQPDAPALHKPLRFGYSASPMLDLGFVRDHMDAIEKMARDRGITLDLAPFREVDTERRR